MRFVAAMLLAGPGWVAAAGAAELTAFDLIKEANRHVGEEARDRVVQLRSEKSINTLLPQTWYIVLYDPDATAKAAEVKFEAGKKVSVKRPARILEPITGAHRELPRAKLRVDSNKALEIATSEPILKSLKLKASALKLERRSASDDTPVWKVELWAAKLDNPNRNVSVGEVFINAEDGKVVKSDLKISRVD
ncbi:MAG: hypothetical protein RJA22_2998 [Verrucomicrobiota bacterium]